LTNRQERDLFGLRVKLSRVTTNLNIKSRGNLVDALPAQGHKRTFRSILTLSLLQYICWTSSRKAMNTNS